MMNNPVCGVQRDDEERNARIERRWYLSTVTLKSRKPAPQQGEREIEPAHWLM
jgi:hypothetical protein